MVAFVAGTTLSAAALNSAFNALSINAQTGTTYTLALTDAGGLVTLTNAAAITLTVPANATVAFPTGSVIAISQQGAGQVTVAGAGGVTVSSSAGLKTAAQYAICALIKTGTNTWTFTGATTS